MSLALENVLVLDIETVRGLDNYEDLSERLQTQWIRKAGYLQKDEADTPEAIYLDRAGIYAEFGKVITISVGFFYQANGAWNFRVTGLANDDEAVLLQDLNALLSKFDQNKLILAAHNGKEFDFPYLSRRMLVNSIKLPPVLDIAGKKPWEVNFLDTMELWKFGDRKNFTSLDLLATIFDIPSSKSDIDGSMVGQVYYETGDLEKISKYCNQDVVVTAQLLLRLNQLPIIAEDNIHIIEA
jgi:predicted PolB exonuclease-like 3'-5' exonuclease